MILWGWAALALAGDKDRDGLTNKVDRCAEEPEDLDSFQDDDGCPDPDNDGDGRPDAEDQCPGEAEDRDSFQDDDGCPDPDDDGDGVGDADDRCADEKEDGGGAPDGCPEVTRELLTGDGYLPAVQNLMSLVVEAASKAAEGAAEEGCRTLAFGAKGWLQRNDPAILTGVWESRLKRAPEGFDRYGVEQQLRQRADVYRTAKPAVDVFCKEDQGWTALAERVDAVFSAIPAADPPPKPTKTKKGR